MEIPSGLILMWAGTNATIPSGWTRETSLDGKYPKAWGTENPNSIGGSNTHSHSDGGHTHSIVAHSHTCSYGAVGDTPHANNDIHVISGHNHANSDIGNLSGGGLQSTTVNWTSVNQEPPYYEIIFIKPDNLDGANLVSGIVTHYNGSSDPAGWAFTPAIKNKYLKGAATGGDAGGTGGGTSHQHTISHTHTVTGHTHSGKTGLRNTDSGLRQYGGTISVAYWSHLHTVSLASNDGSLTSYTKTDAGSGDTVEIAYKKLGLIQYSSGGVIPHIVGMWLGSTASLPAGWVLCDGTKGTLDLRDKYAKCGNDLTENGGTGGANTHTHTGVSHTHTASGTHTHSGSTDGADSCYQCGNGSEGVSPCSHTHSVTVGAQTSTYNNSTSTPSTVSNEPAYRTVAYLELITQTFTEQNDTQANIQITTSSENSTLASISEAISQNDTQANILAISSNQNDVIADILNGYFEQNDTIGNILNTYDFTNYTIANIRNNPFTKTYIYKVYDVDGNFIKTWGEDVLSEPSFSMTINGTPGEMQIKLPRTFDDFGEGVDVALNNEVEVYCYDGDNLNGVLIYSGYISAYKPVVDVDEYLEITLLSKAAQLARLMLRDSSGNTTLTMNSYDPSTMLKDVILYAQADGCDISYSNGTSLLFDGTNAVHVSSLPVTTTSGTYVSVDFWMRWNGTYGKMPCGFGGTPGYGLYFSGSSFGFNTGASDLWGITTTSGMANNWHHIIGCFYNGDAKQSKLYVDGTLQTLTQKTGTTNQKYVTSDFAISGWRHDTNYRLLGRIDEFRMYNKLLTQTDATNHFAGTYDDTDIDLLFYYRFDEKKSGYATAGDTILDYSLKGKNGVAVLTPQYSSNSSPKAVGDSIEVSETVVSYIFNTYTVKEAIDKIIELTPENWYWRIDADKNIYMAKSDLTSENHNFVIGKNITSLSTTRREEDIVNTVYFTGAETAGVNMYRVYTNSASISTYGIHAIKLNDGRVTKTSTADIMANRILNSKNAPEIRTNINVVDNNGKNSRLGYDIESVKPGQTMKIRNMKTGVKGVSLWDVFIWDEDVWDQTLSSAAADVIQIQQVNYSPNEISIDASSRLPEISKRIEDINRNQEQMAEEANPNAPTEVPE